jgi:hypothetical protein
MGCSFRLLTANLPGPYDRPQQLLTECQLNLEHFLFASRLGFRKIKTERTLGDVNIVCPYDRCPKLKIRIA